MNTYQQPQTPKNRFHPIVRFIIGLACVGYLIFPSFGIFELIPDNLPLIGNLDEVTASFVMVNMFNIIPWVNTPSRLRMVLLGFIGIISVIYWLNPTAGIIEFIPDNIPVIGNIDEAIAVFGTVSAFTQVLHNRQNEQNEQNEML